VLDLSAVPAGDGPRGARGGGVIDTITDQRCIGYQRLSDDSLASIIRTEYTSGKVRYRFVWTDERGHVHTLPNQELCPRIDIPQPAT
jgi:hypothetical protein